MNEILKDLFVGNFQDALNVPPEFTSINVAAEHRQTLPKSLYLPWFLPIQGGAQINGLVLNAIAEIIARDLAIERKVLVNCNEGRERSPLTIVWFLMKKRGLSLDEAYNLVKEKRPETLDRREWLKQILENGL